jgi:hypothetical protein
MITVSAIAASGAFWMIYPAVLELGSHHRRIHHQQDLTQRTRTCCRLANPVIDITRT